MQKEAEKKEVQKVPFFARFLVKQEELRTGKWLEPVATTKYPSDSDEHA